MSTLAITNAEIYGNIGTVLGVSGAYATWPTRVQDDAGRIIRAGRRKMFMAYNWSFLEQHYPIVTSPATTVTGVCVNGVITTSGSTIPASMTGNYKVYPQTTGGLYDVAAQSGTIAGSTITLVDTSAANDFASQTITLYKYRYALPSNFASFDGPVVVENWNNSTQLSEYATLPEFQLRGVLNSVNTLVGPPEVFSVTHDVTSETGAFSVYLLVYPLLATAYTLKTKIRIQPGDSLAELAEVFPAVFSELLQEAILAQAEIMYCKTPAVHAQLFGELLPAAIKVDKQMRGTRTLLPRENSQSESNLDRQAIRTATITVATIS